MLGCIAYYDGEFFIIKRNQISFASLKVSYPTGSGSTTLTLIVSSTQAVIADWEGGVTAEYRMTSRQLGLLQFNPSTVVSSVPDLRIRTTYIGTDLAFCLWLSLMPTKKRFTTFFAYAWVLSKSTFTVHQSSDKKS